MKTSIGHIRGYIEWTGVVMISADVKWNISDMPRSHM